MKTAFHDIPENCFPFTITFHEPETGETLWEETVAGPGVFKVPGFGRPVIVVMAFADGTYLAAGHNISKN